MSLRPAMHVVLDRSSTVSQRSPGKRSAPGVRNRRRGRPGCGLWPYPGYAGFVNSGMAQAGFDDFNADRGFLQRP